MASLTNAGPRAHTPWSIAALLHGLHRSLWPPPERIDHAAAGTAHVAAGTTIQADRAKRRYPPQRDRVFEQSAMAREMFRL